ncbi:MAG: translation initiation factor IF-2, partial [Lachnospiraceae bacterium]|nr:translation initiation factor IF-2 [Lachnospiraceae bacterium]
ARGPRTGFGEGRPQGGQRYGDRPAGGYRSGQGGPQRDGRPSAGPGGRGTGAPRTGGFRSGQGSSPFGGSQGRSQGGRPFSAQPGRGPVSGEGKSRRPGGDGFSSEKKRDDKNRKNNQRRDERSRKDRIYTDEQEAVRKNRPGRFIKPEKRPEETVEEQIKMITIPEKITLRDLAEKMHISPAEIIKKLFLKGQVMTPNSELDYEQASNIAEDYDILCEEEEKVDVIEELLKEEDDSEDDMVPRPPVICVMGHVDHGKTSLLDAIRKTNVTDKEAGGITQAIGAYTVSIDGRSITFLDTPGHEAFTAMRMRGANSTDIAVLVVAADDGVMPQTKEAISHAKAAGVEIVVAINKIDKPGANVDRVKQELTEYDLIPTDWGGSTEFAEVSAKTGEGIEDLLETILLTADVMELKANPNRLARGLVLEAKLDKGRGPVANVLVQKGTLHVGDFISAGACSGKVRAMIDDKGRRVKEAKPSQPVEILGLSDVPSAGEVLVAHESNESSKAFAATYKTQHKEELLEETRMRMNLDDLFSQMKEGNLKEFNLIIKADVQGSVEALKASLLKLSNEEVVVKVIHSGVGAITESDVTLASASNAVIIGFGVRPDATAKALADHEGVDVRLYKVIYQAIDAVEAALKGMLAPVYEERVIGHVEVRMLFKASHVGNIAGSYVTDGVIRRGCLCRIRRGDEMIYEGKLASLKRFKDDAKEVKEGFECGLVFDGFDKIQVGDIVEAYDLVEVPRT